MARGVARVVCGCACGSVSVALTNTCAALRCPVPIHRCPRQVQGLRFCPLCVPARGTRSHRCVAQPARRDCPADARCVCARVCVAVAVAVASDNRVRLTARLRSLCAGNDVQVSRKLLLSLADRAADSDQGGASGGRGQGGGHRGGVARAALAHGGGRCGWPAEVRPTAQIRRTAGSRQPADHVECLTTALRRRTD